MANRNWLVPVMLITGCMPIAKPVATLRGQVLVYPKIAQQTQTLVTPNNVASIATLSIVPFMETTPGNYFPISSITGNPTTDGAADMLMLNQTAPVDPNRPFVFSGLLANKNYLFYGRAYSFSGSKISKESTSFVPLAVGTNDAPSMANLPIYLTNIPFSATTAVQVNVSGRYEFLKSTLFLVAGNAQVAVCQTSRTNPDLVFENLEGNTNYKLVVEAYKLGASRASASLNLDTANDNAPATQSLSLSVPYIVTTLAGTLGAAGSLDGTGSAARINWPSGLLLDGTGNLYVTGYFDYAIRKITNEGVVSTFAGSLGTNGSVDGTGYAARFGGPCGITRDAAGNLYVADAANNAIRKISSSGVVTTFAGYLNSAGTSDGQGTSARFYYPTDVAIDGSGNFFVADRNNNVIRKITSAGAVSTFAGSMGVAGSLDGTGNTARFNWPAGIAIDGAGNLFVADYNNCAIRKITSAGVVTTLAGALGTAGTSDGTGSNARFNGPNGITIDNAGNFFVGDRQSHTIRKITSNGVVTTIAGSPGVAGGLDGVGSSARLHEPGILMVDPEGKLYLGDILNHAIRKIY